MKKIFSNQERERREREKLRNGIEREDIEWEREKKKDERGRKVERVEGGK